MSAREALSQALWDNCTSDQKSAFIDAFAHELAEEIRQEADDLHQTEPGVVRGLRIGADLIDPEVSSNG